VSARGALKQAGHRAESICLVRSCSSTGNLVAAQGVDSVDDGGMDGRDYGELYRHLRSALQRSGRSDLDNQIVESQRLYDSRGSGEDVESYLVALRQEMILLSSGALRQTMERFRSVESPSGGVTGIVVDIQDQDRASFGDVESIDLVGSAGLDALIDEIDELLARVREDRANE
jgi:hypothetical protein